MVSLSTSVLIVGAGPVGLTLACELARRGVSFRLVERATVPPQSSRAKALQPRSLEILNDLGLAEELMSVGTTDLPFKKFAGNRLIVQTERSVFPREDTRYPKTLLLPQWRAEQSLRARLGQLGGTIEWGTKLTELTATDTGVTARLQTVDGTEDLTCTYLIACDGGKSKTRKKLGIHFVGETHQGEQLWVGDVELEGLSPDAWYNWLSPEFGLAFALFPFKGTKTWQLQAVMPPDEDGNTPEPTLEGFNALFRQRTQMEGVTFTGSTWQSIYRVNIRRADRFRSGNAFIAGDAAHAHSIAGGMGMNTGIQDAYNLGWKLAAVLHGQAGTGLLDSYAEERIAIADLLLTTTSERQKVMMAAAAAGSGALDKIASRDTTQLDLNYRHSRLNGQSAATESSLLPGDRAPDVLLADGTWLSHHLHGPQWKLLIFGEQTASQAKSLNIVQAGDPAITRAYGLTDGVVLIRPDGYIALISRDSKDVDRYFEQLAV